MNKTQVQSEAYSRAVGNMSTRNYTTIIVGFVDKGLSPDVIIPRVNVFTYNAWRSQNRQVRKGEKGVKVTTWIPIKDRKTGTDDDKRKVQLRPKSATVFHISQTDAVETAVS